VHRRKAVPDAEPSPGIRHGRPDPRSDRPERAVRRPGKGANPSAGDVVLQAEEGRK